MEGELISRGLQKSACGQTETRYLDGRTKDARIGTKQLTNNNNAYLTQNENKMYINEKKKK